MASEETLPQHNLTWDQVRDTLNRHGGQVTNDVRTAFAETAAINPWSKRKPVRYDKVTPLSPSEFRGQAADTTQGIYYGLKGGAPSRYEELHETGYEYVGRPDGTASQPFRLSDFAGYDPLAVATLAGTLPERAYTNAANSLQCVIRYDSTGSNDTGVDIGDFVPPEVAQDIGGYYPCILLGTYAKALYNTRTVSVSEPKGKQTTLRYNGSWDAAWHADLTDLPGALTGPQKATLFLAPQISGITANLTGWVDTRNALFMQGVFAVPGAVGCQVELEEYSAVPKIHITTVATYSDLSGGKPAGLMVNWDFDDPRAEDAMQTGEGFWFTITLRKPSAASKKRQWKKGFSIIDPNPDENEGPLDPVLPAQAGGEAKGGPILLPQAKCNGFSWDELGLLLTPGSHTLEWEADLLSASSEGGRPAQMDTKSGTLTFTT